MCLSLCGVCMCICICKHVFRLVYSFLLELSLLFNIFHFLFNKCNHDLCLRILSTNRPFTFKHRSLVLCVFLSLTESWTITQSGSASAFFNKLKFWFYAGKSVRTQFILVIIILSRICNRMYCTCSQNVKSSNNHHKTEIYIHRCTYLGCRLAKLNYVKKISTPNDSEFFSNWI